MGNEVDAVLLVSQTSDSILLAAANDLANRLGIRNGCVAGILVMDIDFSMCFWV